MTKDKQIIIDGVDVHWCEHYTGNIGYLTDKNWTCRAKSQGTKCEDWSDCYFKRWQRKEQECEELKETFDGLFKVQYKLADNNKKLRQCLTEIKEIAEENDELLQGYHKEWANNKLILQKISEVEDEHNG